MKKIKHNGCIEKIMDENHSLKTKVRELEISLANSYECERDLKEKIKELEAERVPVPCYPLSLPSFSEILKKKKERSNE